MTARDDYPEASGLTLGLTLAAYVRQHAAMCDEIDMLRGEVRRLDQRCGGYACEVLRMRELLASWMSYGGCQDNRVATEAILHPEWDPS